MAPIGHACKMWDDSARNSHWQRLDRCKESLLAFGMAWVMDRMAGLHLWLHLQFASAYLHFAGTLQLKTSAFLCCTGTC
ncbi:hypothetical protein HAX54_040318 [Datura stramonium]|uniref:Uncharacterized protein n=1 Tax=Datura stramonium TaxID=4076 RepID=A0ABS8VSB1_DATST|nr:hypothetical protein [Datura stramonium]